MFLKSLLSILILTMCFSQADAQKKKVKMKSKGSAAVAANSDIITGAERLDQYLPLLKDKKVAMLVNQTSVVGKEHLVDVLRKNGVDIKVVFAPEHGFRGDAPDGAKIATVKDPVTGIPIVSLYGKKLKPAKEDLEGVDVMIYDIQDVGARFYTFISSMQYFMEAAVESNIPLIILDRPNPNGWYVDGPVLDTAYRSFTGMQPIPIVYGMTIGEYAYMLAEEGWLRNDSLILVHQVHLSDGPIMDYIPRPDPKHTLHPLNLTIVLCLNYTHKSHYVLPVRPSPNLPEIQSVLWYPSICFFEATVISEGRGTDKPFEYFGHPLLPKTMFSFTPKPNAGAPSPKYNGQVCYGWNVSGSMEDVIKKIDGKLQLKYLLEAYRLFPDKENFFHKDFNRLSGDSETIKLIKAGASEEEIRKAWEPKLSAFKKIRKKYLLYTNDTPNP